MLPEILKKAYRDEDGQSTTEYVLVIALVVVTCIVVLRLFGKKIRELFIKAAEELK